MCCAVANAVKTELKRAGFITNDEKSVWEPCKKLDWLGITWDRALGTIQTIKRRLSKLSDTIDSIVESDFVVSARKLASFSGQVISTSPVVGNISRIMTRHCIMSTLFAQHWDAEVVWIDIVSKSCCFGGRI